MREIIKVKNVSKVYKINKRKSGLFGAVLNLFAPRYEKKIAVSDMNFSIEEGEAVAFIGSNGAGKSTTIKMLSGILYPSEGEITVASYVPYKQRKKYVSIDNDRNCILDTIGENNRKEEFDNTNEYLIKMNLEADCLKVQFISDASTKELKMMIERLAPVEVGLMVKTWGNGGFLEVDFKESQAIISNK